MAIPFFSNLAFAMLAFLLTYAAGTFLLALSGREAKGFYAEFSKMTLGIWSLVAVYSLVRTGGATLSLALIPAALCALYFYRPRRPFRFQFSPRHLVLGILLLLVFFIFLYLDIYDPVRKLLYYFSIDLPVQASQVEKLNLTGIESTTTDLLFREPVRDLYHYGDLWFPAFFTWLFRMKAMAAVYFVFASVLATAITLGALAIYEMKGNAGGSRWPGLLLALGFLSLSGISCYIPKSGWLDARWGEHFNLLALAKAYLVVLSVLWAILALLKRDRMAFTLALLPVIPLYFVAAPALFLAWGLFMLIAVWRRQWSVRQAGQLMVPLLLVGLTFVAWVAATQSGEGALSRFVIGVNATTYLYEVLYTAAYTGVRVLIALWPFLLILFWKRREILSAPEDREILRFLLLGIGASIFVYSLFYFHVDGFQFWTVPNAVLSACLVFYILLRLKDHAWLKVAVLLICLYQNKVAYTDPEHTRKPYAVDQSFVACMLKHMPDDEASKVALLRRPVTRANDPLWGSDPNLYYPYDLLKWYADGYNPYTLTLLDTEISEDPRWAAFQQAYIRHSAFYRFVQRQHRDKSFVSTEQSQADFIRQQDIRLVLFAPGAKPNPQIDSLVQIVCRDETTGYRLGVVRRNISQQ